MHVDSLFPGVCVDRRGAIFRSPVPMVQYDCMISLKVLVMGTQVISGMLYIVYL